MRPLFSYYGGKQRMASRIIPLLPPHTVYVEPYAGSSSILFAKPRHEPTNGHHYREVLNDHDERIMTIYRVCQDATTRQLLLDRLQYTPYSRAEHARALAIVRQGWTEADPITQAWAMLVNLQQSFSNKLNGGWGIGVFSRNLATTWANWQDTLPILMDRLRNVHLECDDALAVIRRWDSPQTVFYCDPPYVDTDQGHYTGFTEADMKALITVMQTCHGSIVLSGYDCGAIPHTWEHFTFDAYCSASCQGKTYMSDRSMQATSDELGNRRRVEHVWRVDRSATMRPELKDVVFGRKSRPLPLFEDEIVPQANE